MADGPLAENYINSGMADKARECLEKIIQACPNTEFAVLATKKLEELNGTNR